MKVSVVNSAGPVSVGTMQVTLSIAITKVRTCVAIMQVFRFFCNYDGGTF